MGVEERLEQAVRNEMCVQGYGAFTERTQRVVDAVKLALVDPRTVVWPGMEGEGLERLLARYVTVYADARAEGADRDTAERTARTAEAAYHWRSLVASLPEVGHGKTSLVAIRWVERDGSPGITSVPRAALAALAYPYDGGGK